MFGRKNKTANRNKVTRNSLRPEALEKRELFAADLVGDTLQIIGDSRNDYVQVDQFGSYVRLYENGNFSWHRNVKNIQINSGDGHDTIVNNTSINSRIDTGNGNDTVLGGSGRDVINGGEGSDYLAGRSGNDFIEGWSGNDRIHGGAGNDDLRGGFGNDRVYGEHGNDKLYGWDGDDYLNGGSGNDTLQGWHGNDHLVGGTGDDYIEGWSGNDRIYGGSGNDELRGGEGHDVVYGEQGNDLIYGWTGNDSLYGGQGDDRMYGSYGHDNLQGGDGNDTLYGGAGYDRLYGQNGNDTLVSIDGTAFDHLYGGLGRDQFWMDDTDRAVGTDAYETANTVNKVKNFANGADKTLNGDNIADPTDAGTTRNFKNNPLFGRGGPSSSDITQGAMGDCWLLAALGAVADNDADKIREAIVDLGDGTYAVNLGDKFYRIDADLSVTNAATGDRTGNYDLVYAEFGQQGSIWASLFEKAYTMHRGTQNTYGSIDGGGVAEAFSELGLTNIQSRTFTRDASAGLRHMQSELAAGKTVTFGTYSQPGASINGFVAFHAYMVQDVTTDARGNVTGVQLRNPWGGSNAVINVPLSALASMTFGVGSASANA